MTDLVPDLQVRVDAVREKHGVPGVGLAIRRDQDEVAVFSGISSQEGSDPVGERTVFELGSVSKAYTATALMRLVADGQLDLDEPLGTYLPDVKLPEGGQRAVTLRLLLNHTSGLDGDHILDTGADDGALERYAATLGDVVQVTGVGEVFSYNNTAFVLAGRLLEQATGLHWRAAMMQLLVEPLALTDTFPSAAVTPADRLARGHVNGPNGLMVAPASGIPRSLEPAGGICASVRDVLRFADVHLGIEDLLPGGLRRQMSATSVRVPDPSLGAGWGLGLAVLRDTEPRVVGHDGGTVGHVAALRMLPERGIAVAIAVNSSAGGPAVISELMNSLLEELANVVPNPPVEPVENRDTASSWPVGTYAREGFRIEIQKQGTAAKVAVALNELASAALGTSTLGGDLRATTSPDVFVSNLFDPNEWTPLVVMEHGGQRYLHLNGRAHTMIET